MGPQRRKWQAEERKWLYWDLPKPQKKDLSANFEGIKAEVDQAIRFCQRDQVGQDQTSGIKIEKKIYKICYLVQPFYSSKASSLEIKFGYGEVLSNLCENHKWEITHVWDTKMR